MMWSISARAQTYTFTPLYEFNGTSGSSPKGTLVADSAGNLYGTTEKGGADNYGTVFELVNNAGAYTEQVLYSFTDSSDGEYPSAGLAIDAAGNLYGTANAGSGQVFELVNRGGGVYSFNLLYTFTGGSNGVSPEGSLTLDANGDLYGVTSSGGANYGIVFELVNSGGVYTEQTLYSFPGGSGPSNPDAGVTLDAGGNIYGTTVDGGADGWGTVYELVNNGGAYTEETLYSFTDGPDGASPQAGVILDSQGNLYGTTQGDGTNWHGSVFELVNSAGAYTESTLHVFTSGGGDGTMPASPVDLDASGDIFGTTEAGGALNDGTVYELPRYSNGVYGAEILYSFTGEADGDQPSGGIFMDSSGDLFGTSKKGGTAGDGTVWELSTGPTATTSLTITSSVNPVFQGESATLLATVATNPADESLSGTITFSEGATVLGTASVANNTAVFTIPAALLGTGSNTISAQFTPSSSSVQGSSASVEETVNPASDLADLNGSNTFTGNQTVNGGVTASSFSGNGAGLTNVIAAALNCAACVGNAQLGVNYAASASQGGAASNALLLGGLPPSSFATLESNSFNGDQSISGSLIATGNLSGTNGSFSGTVSSAGLSVGPAGTATASQAYNSGALDASASLFNSNAGAAQNLLFQWQAEPVAATNNTANPAATLNLLYGLSGAPAETGLSINANGTINFAAGQTFPGATSGTITGVTAGTGLTGGGTSGSITLSLGSNACAAGSALTALPFTCSPVVVSGSSPTLGAVTAATFSGGSFTGNGAGLTGVTAAALSGNIPESQVTNLGTDLQNNLTTAESFATSAANGALVAAQDFAINAANTAQSGAQAFASAAANASQSNAETFATSAAGTAQQNAMTSAESFANSTFLPLAGGTLTGSLSSPAIALPASGTATASQAYSSGALDAGASLFNSAAGAAQSMDFRWQAEPAAGTNNTASPAATLNLLYGANGTPAETGLSVNANGTINFAAGQTFPGATSGTITGVTPGTGLTGGGTSGNVTLGIASAGVSNAMLANPSFTLTAGTGLTGGGTVSLGGAANIQLAANACPSGSALTALPFTCSPIATAGTNTFTGSQTVNGTVTATAFVGNGAGLTNIDVATATTAATATNALALGGEPPSYYATAGGNTYTGTQTMPGVNVTGATQTGALTIGGGSPITEYVSVTDTITLPPIHPGECTTFETAPLTGFTPGNDDTLSLGVPRSLLTDLHGNPAPWPDPYRAMNHGPKIFLVYQAWETASSTSTTVTLQVCNPSTDYRGGDSGTVRIDVLKH